MAQEGNAETDVTLLLQRWTNGDVAAFDEVSKAVYPELRRIASAYLHNERTDHTLQPTALIHEAFLRLVDAGNLRFESRRHFFALSAQLMRRILVDHARTISAAKRGGGLRKVSLQTLVHESGSADNRRAEVHAADDLLLVNEALDELEKFSPRKAKIIELRYFGGLTLEEIGDAVGISTASVHNEVRLAEAWLSDRLSA